MNWRSVIETGLGKAGLDVFLSFLASLSLMLVICVSEKNFPDRIYDVALGVLVSTLFYYLIVKIPDFQKRQRLKQNLRTRYKIFRRECIQLVTEVADGFFDSDVCAKLDTPSAFREYFKQEISDGQTRWDAFENRIAKFHLDIIFTNLELFREEILFLLSNADLSDEKAFILLKRLSIRIYVARTATIGYDEIKPLAHFLYEILAGWSFVDGYTERDIVSDIIESI